MSGPIGVDATLKAMVQLINRVAKDAAFRQLCESDMAAAVAQLETAPPEGTRFEYADDAGDHVLRVHRGGETTTVTLAADGRLTIDNDALGVPARSEDAEMSDAELLAISGGSVLPSTCDDQPTTQLKKICKAVANCYGHHHWPTWDAIDECVAPTTPATCLGYNTNTLWTYAVICEQST